MRGSECVKERITEWEPTHLQLTFPSFISSIISPVLRNCTNSQSCMFAFKARRFPFLSRSESLEVSKV